MGTIPRLVVLLILVFQHSSLRAEYSKFRITTSPASQMAPDISGNIVVWCDYRHSISGPAEYRTPCIYGANISDPNNPIEFLVSKQGLNEEYPQISGQYVAFNVTRYNCQSNYDKIDIYLCNLDESLQQLTNLPCGIPDYANGCGNDGKYIVSRIRNTIRGYDIETNSLFEIPILLSSSFLIYVTPDVSEGNVVWTERNDGSNYTIHVFSIAEWHDYIVSSSTIWTASPKIDGSILVFARNADIYAIDISNLNAPREFQVCTNEFVQDDPAISGNIIVWEDNRNGNSDIYGYDLIAQKEFCVISDADAKTFPAIDGQTVVWVNNKYGQSDIYGTILDGSVAPYCNKKFRGDLNNDCRVDIYDLTILCEDWLACNLEPASACF